MFLVLKFVINPKVYLRVTRTFSAGVMLLDLVLVVSFLIKWDFKL